MIVEVILRVYGDDGSPMIQSTRSMTVLRRLDKPTGADLMRTQERLTRAVQGAQEECSEQFDELADIFDAGP